MSANFAVLPGSAQVSDKTVERHQTFRFRRDRPGVIRRVRERDQCALRTADLGQQPDRIEIGAKLEDVLARCRVHASVSE